MNISFAGCGFLGIYHVGVVSCLRVHAPHLIKQLSGASAGALAACSLLCDLPLDKITSDTLNVAVTARKYRLGAFNPKFDVARILKERLTAILPKDAYEKCTGRLNISCTRLIDGKNVILNEFVSNEELIQALTCSAYIPVFSGMGFPSYRNVTYIDGCYSNNLPKLNNNTITVSPFSGNADICPKDNTYNLEVMKCFTYGADVSVDNIRRLTKVMFPSDPEIMTQLCRQGFRDAMRFLKEKNLVACDTCINTGSPAKTTKTNKEMTDDEKSCMDEIFSNKCLDCRNRSETIQVNDLPEAVLFVLQEACQAMNSGIINWIFNRKPMKYLSWLTLPYTLSLDIACVFFTTAWEYAPKITQEVNKLLKYLLDYVTNMLKQINYTEPLLIAKLKWDLDLTQYKINQVGYVPKQAITCANKEMSARKDKPRSSYGCVGQLNFGFDYSVHEPNSIQATENALNNLSLVGDVDQENSTTEFDSQDAKTKSSSNIDEVTLNLDEPASCTYLNENQTSSSLYQNTSAENEQRLQVPKLIDTKN